MVLRMLDQRKAEILRAVVAEYIRTAQPVGSSSLADRIDLGVSSATVRNELAWLEKEGFLTHPHTSAGRVPTESGYRFFVNGFSQDQEKSSFVLPKPLANEIQSFFSKAYNELDDMLQETTRLLAHLTQCAAVVVEPAHDQSTVLSLQLVPMSSSQALLVVVLSDGSVEKRAIETTATDDAIAQYNETLTKSMQSKTLAQIQAAQSGGSSEADRVVEACRAALLTDIRSDNERAFVGGAAEIVSSFEALEEARHVLDALEQQYVVVSLLRDVMTRGDNVAIGSELGLDYLRECAVVASPFSGEGNSAGAIGVVGPTRMDYQTVLAAISQISEQLSRRIAEG